ncbi:Protein HOL1 [Lachnellula suecica]|uniref:Protein HOL1 n=1 Tax=Lachnellula suecica TaxID=602035 RepID=A0A8T9BVW0_9HELO|nr:Protein HOL1 [Lachnellula suecica]
MAPTQIELVPGTEILLSTEDGTPDKLILIPEPSDRSDDPLNWSTTWKTIVIANQAIFVFISILTPLAIAPLTPIFIQEFHKSIPEVNMLFGAAAMALGYANFIIVPFSNVFGRRPTILICGLICVLANIWQARVTSYNSFLAARVISGLGAAANESIMPMVIGDVMFLHQRGLWMGVYFWAYFIGVSLGPIISGNIAAHISWRWFFWVCTILQGVSLLMMVFMFPETLYRRSSSIPNAVDSSSSHGSSTPETKSEEPTITAAKLSSASSKELSARSNEHIPTATSHHITGRPTPAQFSLIPRLHLTPLEIKQTLLLDVLAPLQIVFYPIILWVIFAFGMTTTCLLALNLTQSQVFAAPPYNFSPAAVGFVNFALVVGGIVGLCTAGPVSDWLSLRLARRNGGVREPEMRLWVLVPYVAICLVGMTITAVGYQRHWPWQAIVVIGYGFVGIISVSLPTILISYAVDCYKHIPGQIMVSSTVVKNTFGFGLIFFFNDWAVSDGFIPPVLTIMALSVGSTVVGMVVFLRWGKSFRRRTAGSRLHDL